MPKTDKRVDAYIAKSPEFARPILTHVRKLIHTACPDVEETIKWSVPAFDYNGPLAGIAAFKQHCMFNFWKASLIPGAKGYLFEDGDKPAICRRLTNIKELPPDKMILGFVKAAMKLNAEGTKVVKKVVAKEEIPMPDHFAKALKKNKKAATAFEAFSPSHKREYLAWIAEAKTEETKLKRQETAIEWIAEGKSRNWKYQK